VKALAEDIYHQQMPVGPVGHPTELHLCTQAMVFAYTQYPNAAKEYLRFMYEKPQYEAWQNASIGYVAHPLDAYKDNKVWHDDPKALPYRDAVKNMSYNGFAGKLGYSSAAAMADYIVVDMFASVCSGDVTPADAAAAAEKRANRFYRV
jgi:multiple sugar transport system substrate-binding protein